MLGIQPRSAIGKANEYSFCCTITLASIGFIFWEKDTEFELQDLKTYFSGFRYSSLYERKTCVKREFHMSTSWSEECPNSSSQIQQDQQLCSSPHDMTV